MKQLHKQHWLTFDLSDDDPTPDQVFADIFKERYGYEPEEIFREHKKVIRVWVGPVRKEG